jgi:hypothetical protein
MALVRALLTPTTSGDDAGALLCDTATFASLFRGMSSKDFTNLMKTQFFCPVF